MDFDNRQLLFWIGLVSQYRGCGGVFGFTFVDLFFGFALAVVFYIVVIFSVTVDFA